MGEFLAWLETNLGSSDIQADLLYTLVIILLLWALRSGVLRMIQRYDLDARQYYNWVKGTQYLTYIVAVLIIGPIWFRELTSFGTYLGLLSAGLAIALKDPLTNLVGWVFILFRHPFRVGDRIQIGTHAGDVIDLRPFVFSLLEIGNWVYGDQSTGRVMHIPNQRIFMDPVANYSQGMDYIWNEIPIIVTFESNWEKAKEIFQAIIERHTAVPEVEVSNTTGKKGRKTAVGEFIITYAHLTPIVYTHLKEHGVLLVGRYLCLPRERRGTTNAIIEDLLRTLRGHPDISFAYPTQRFVGGEGFIPVQNTPPFPPKGDQ